MQPRSLDQIMSELSSTYDPQIQQVEARKALIPGQIQAEEQGLGAKQEQAFGDILGGARRRGLGFSGIPLGEQAKYTATEYLPALARLRQSGREQEMSLQDAILGINERRDTLAQQLRQQELQQAEQARQFNENLNLQRQQFEESKRQAARSAAGGFSPSFGAAGGAQPSTAQVTPQQQKVYNQARSLSENIGKTAWATSELDAILKSAERGNANDKLALQLFYQFRGQNPPARAAKAMA